MPAFIVKPQSHEDFYVEWSTVVDAPLRWGSRQECAEAGVPEERLARADAKGTSMRDPVLPPDRQWFGWHDHDFIVMELDIPDRAPGSYSVPRGNVRALCERIERDEDPTDLLTFEPWDDES